MSSQAITSAPGRLVDASTLADALGENVSQRQGSQSRRVMADDQRSVEITNVNLGTIPGEKRPLERGDRVALLGFRPEASV